MKKQQRPCLWILTYILADLFCVGLGMGVPFFNILFGFIVGWFLVTMFNKKGMKIELVLKKVFLFSILTSVFTFLIMLLIWGRTFTFLFDPSFDVANFGLPLILYDPLASFIGWQVLMIVISPFLQLLTTIFSAYLAVILKKAK